MRGGAVIAERSSFEASKDSGPADRGGHVLSPWRSCATSFSPRGSGDGLSAERHLRFGLVLRRTVGARLFHQLDPVASAVGVAGRAICKGRSRRRRRRRRQAPRPARSCHKVAGPHSRRSGRAATPAVGVEADGATNSVRRALRRPPRSGAQGMSYLELAQLVAVDLQVIGPPRTAPCAGQDRQHQQQAPPATERHARRDPESHRQPATLACRVCPPHKGNVRHGKPGPMPRAGHSREYTGLRGGAMTFLPIRTKFARMWSPTLSSAACRGPHGAGRCTGSRRCAAIPPFAIAREAVSHQRGLGRLWR